MVFELFTTVAARAAFLFLNSDFINYEQDDFVNYVCFSELCVLKSSAFAKYIPYSLRSSQLLNY